MFLCTQNLIRISESIPLPNFINLLGRPDLQESNIKDQSIRPINNPDATSIFSPRTSKSVSSYFVTTPEIKDTEHPLLQRLESLGVNKEHMGKMLKHMLPDSEENKGFLDKFIGKIKNFFSQFFSFY